MLSRLASAVGAKTPGEVADVQAGPAAPTEAPAAKENRKKEKAKKANIEATSDEGEDSASD